MLLPQKNLYAITAAIAQRFSLLINNYYQKNQASLNQNPSMTHALPEKPDLTSSPIKPTCIHDAYKVRIDNTPAWMDKVAKFQEDKSSNKPCEFFISAQVILVSENVPYQRDITLRVRDGLPAAELRLVDCDAHKVPCIFYLDSYASMNSDNLLVHQWLVTKYPDIVDPYEQFDDANPFRTIVLSGNIDTDDMENFESGNLTAVVTYKTRYDKVYGTPVKVSFGLGWSLGVNEIVGLPSLTDWKMIF